MLISYEQLMGSPGRMPAALSVRTRSGPMIRLSTKGDIHQPACFTRNDGVEVPVEGGLFDELTFGPVPMVEEHIDVAAYRLPTRSHVQLWDYGAIYLGGLVMHPWVRRFGLSTISSYLGLEAGLADAVLRGQRILRDGVWESPDGGPGSVGCRALALYAGTLGLEFPWAVNVWPVIPAGLRGPYVNEDDMIVFPWFTESYFSLLEGLDHEMPAPEASSAERAADSASLQDLLEDFIFTGATALVELVRGDFGEQCLRDAAQASGAEALLTLLRGELYFFNAYLQGLGLEVVPMTPEGQMDLNALGKWDVDTHLHGVSRSYRQAFGPPSPQVVASAPEGEMPHVHANAFVLRDEPVLLTSGMSLAPVFSARHARRELVVLLPAGTSHNTITPLLSHLAEFARVQLGLVPPYSESLVPGSKLVTFGVFPSETWRRIGTSLVHGAPTIDVAVGLTEPELRFYLEGDRQRLQDLLESKGYGLVTHVERGSVV